MGTARELPRPGVLFDLSVSFTVPGPRSQWRALLNGLGLADASARSGSLVAFTALEESPGPDARALTVKIRLAPDKARWSMELEDREDDYPAEVVARSEALGGYPGVVARIAELWPETPEVSVSIDATFGVFKRDWSSAWPGHATQTADAHLVLVEQTWLVEGREPLVEVSRFPSVENDSVMVIGASLIVPLVMRSTLIQDLDRQAWDALTQVLEPRATSKPRGGRPRASR